MDRLHAIADAAEKRNPVPRAEVKPAYLTASDVQALQRLSESDLQNIDNYIFSYVSTSWRKNTYIVGLTFCELSDQYPDLSDVCYSIRLKYHAAKYAFEVKGEIDLIRYCELKYDGPGIR